jgi:hypothetical protein
LAVVGIREVVRILTTVNWETSSNGASLSDMTEGGRCHLRVGFASDAVPILQSGLGNAPHLVLGGTGAVAASYRPS